MIVRPEIYFSDLSSINHAFSADEFLLNHAPRWRLQKLRKEDLLRLCALVELNDNMEAFNKADIIKEIISTRSARALSQQTASTSSKSDVTENEDVEASEPGPSRKRPRTVSRRRTEMFPFTKLRGMAASRSASMGNLPDRLPTRGLPSRVRYALFYDSFELPLIFELGGQVPNQITRPAQANWPHLSLSSLPPERPALVLGSRTLRSNN